MKVGNPSFQYLDKPGRKLGASFSGTGKRIDLTNSERFQAKRFRAKLDEVFGFGEQGLDEIMPNSVIPKAHVSLDLNSRLHRVPNFGDTYSSKLDWIAVKPEESPEAEQAKCAQINLRNTL